jgi:single-stranded DNA-binding protein
MQSISKTTLSSAFLSCFVGKITVKEKNGKKVCYMRVSTHRRTISDGKRVELTDWHNVVAYEPLSSVIEEYVSVGNKIFIAGDLENWDLKDENGKDVIKCFIKANNIDFKSEASVSLIGFVSGYYREAIDKPVYLKVQTSRKVMDNNNKVDKFDIHKVVVYGILANTLEPFLQNEGSNIKLSVVGNLETREDNNGNEEMYVRARKVRVL